MKFLHIKSVGTLSIIISRANNYSQALLSELGGFFYHFCYSPCCGQKMALMHALRRGKWG